MMKAQIKRAWQAGSNFVTFEYESGARRVVGINAWGYYDFAKTQADFMNAANVFDCGRVRCWIKQGA